MSAQALRNVLLIAADPDRRYRLTCLLQRRHIRRGFRIVSVGSDAAEALLNMPTSVRIHLVLVDADDPHFQDLRGWASIRLLLPGLPLFAVTDGENRRSVESALSAGVAALHKVCAVEVTFPKAAQSVLGGGLDFDPGLLEHGRTMLLSSSSTPLCFAGGLAVRLAQEEFYVRGTRVSLSPLERKVLAYLLRNRQRPVSTDELLRSVWGVSILSGGTADQVRGSIKRIRRALRGATCGHQYVDHVKGSGYQFREPVVPSADQSHNSVRWN